MWVGANRSVSLRRIVSATDILFRPQAVDASHSGGGEERAEVVDDMVNMVARAAFGGPIRRIAYPGRGHPESGGPNKDSCNVFDHQCGARAHLVPPQQFVIAGEGGLR